MKRIFTLLLAIFCLSATNVSAQLADGTVAPDFTITDINGVEHNLYDILDEGKTVILDLYAVWCGPCWSYHQGHSLADLYETLGIDGLDNVVIMGVEADPSTAPGDIMGGGDSIGDWTDGAPYTLANDDNIADAYNLAYYPTIYKICPGEKTVFEIGQLSYDVLVPTVFDATCMPPVSSNDVGMLGYKGSEIFCGDGDVSVDVVNMGTEPITSIDLAAMDANGDMVTTNTWTGTLGSYEIASVPVGEVAVDQTIDLTFSATNAMDEVMTNNMSSVTLSPATLIEDYRMTVEILTDQYGDETYWAFVDGSGNIVADGGNPNVGFTNAGAGYPDAHEDMYAGNTMYTIEVSLPNEADCYDFIMTDGYGDGMCCAYGDGFYKVTDSNGNIVAEGAEYQATKNNPFEKAATVSSEEVVIANAINMFPNPANEVLNVSFDIEETTRLEVAVYNTIGQMVKTVGIANYAAGTNNMTINTSDFTNGMYLLTIKSDEGTTSQKFTVSK